MNTPRICPICGKEYTEAPALSRKDNATYICPDCGTREALAKAGLPAGIQDLIVAQARKSRNR